MGSIRNILPLIGLCLMAVSCSKGLSTDEILVKIDRSCLESTKAGPSSETAVTKMDAFIFDADGAIKAVGSVSGGATQVKLKAVKEKGMTVAVVLNCPADLSGTKTLSDITDREVALEENSSSLVMYGSRGALDLTATGSVTVEVGRIATRALIRNITNDLPAAYASDFRITGIYLVNVTGSVRMDGTPLTAKWYNWRSFDAASEVTSLTADIFSKSLSKGESETAEHRLYACGNPTVTDTSADNADPRMTRLVVQTLICGDTYYYPISLKGADDRFNSATSYEINHLTIMSLGSSDPDVPVAKGTISLSVTVSGWDGSATYFESF